MIEVDLVVRRPPFRLPAWKIIRSVETSQGNRAEHRNFVTKMIKNTPATLDIKIGQATAGGETQHAKTAEVVAVFAGPVVKPGNGVRHIEQIPGPHRKTIFAGCQGVADRRTIKAGFGQQACRLATALVILVTGNEPTAMYTNNQRLAGLVNQVQIQMLCVLVGLVCYLPGHSQTPEATEWPLAQASVQPSMPWPVLRCTPSMLLGPINGWLFGVMGRKPPHSDVVLVEKSAMAGAVFLAVTSNS